MNTITNHIRILITGIWLALLPVSISVAADRQFTVVIDAGHGGHDPGAIGQRGKEKNINLSVALKLGRMIERSGTGTHVLYTRKTDVFVPLHKRADIANNAKADLFISIHTNSVASKNSKVSGTETYTLGLYRTQENLEVAKKENSVILIENDYRQRYAGFNPNSSESYIIFEFLQDKYMSQSVSFAKMVQKQFKHSAKRIDKGVHQAGFLVLRETSMPSVLIELGYITNPTEESYLLSDFGTSELAGSIFKAYLEFIKKKKYTTDNSTADNYKDNNNETEISSEEINSDKITNDDTLKLSLDDNIQPTQTESRNYQNNFASERVKPVFKIQILTSDRVLPRNSRLFKGLSPVDVYKEKRIYKYTYAESTDYNFILRTKRQKVDSKFKDAFIIAFKNGVKIDVNQAIREFKQNK